MDFGSAGTAPIGSYAYYVKGKLRPSRPILSILNSICDHGRSRHSDPEIWTGRGDLRMMFRVSNLEVKAPLRVLHSRTITQQDRLT